MIIVIKSKEDLIMHLKYHKDNIYNTKIKPNNLNNKCQWQCKINKTKWCNKWDNILKLNKDKLRQFRIKCLKCKDNNMICINFLNKWECKIINNNSLKCQDKIMICSNFLNKWECRNNKHIWEWIQMHINHQWEWCQTLNNNVNNCNNKKRRLSYLMKILDK